MSGRHSHPSGEPCRASQRRARPAAPKVLKIEVPRHWETGCSGGAYRRDAGDGGASRSLRAERVYSVRRAGLSAPAVAETEKREP